VDGPLAASECQKPLRWNRIDLDRKLAQAREALEETKAHGIRFQSPKSKAGRRDITVPDVLVDVLREHRKAMLQRGCSSGADACPTTRCCSRTSTADRDVR
jgi:integrase